MTLLNLRNNLPAKPATLWFQSASSCGRLALGQIFNHSTALFALMAIVLSVVATSLHAQTGPNVLIVEVTEPGFGVFDGPSIYDASFKSVTGGTLEVEPYTTTSQSGFGTVSRYFIHGLKGEDMEISSPAHETKIVRTSGETFVDVWLSRQESTPVPISSRYWYGPGVGSSTDVTAAELANNSDLYLASSQSITGRIAIGRMDRPATLTQETSPTGAALTTFNSRLFLAWEGTGNRKLNVMSSSDGVNWGGKVTFTDISNVRPAIAGNGSEIILCWTGTDHHINFMSSSDGVNWGNKQVLGEQSDTSPAILAAGGNFFVSWFSYGSRTLNVASWDGQSLNKFTSADTSDFAPSLSLLNGNLMVNWAGTHNLNINSMVVDTYNYRFGNKQTFALTSQRTPTVLSYRWPSVHDTPMALPLFIYTDSQGNKAMRYWSDLTEQPAVEATSLLHPQYMILSVVYAPPGTRGKWSPSSVSYSQNSSLGNSVSITDSFKSDNKVTFNGSFGPFLSIGANYGMTSSSDDQVTDEVRLSTQGGITYYGAPVDGVYHKFDVIYLWLNPEVNLGVTASGIEWGLGTEGNGIADILEVGVTWLVDPRTMPVRVRNALTRHGITVADYPKILAADPFVTSKSPALDPHRFIPLSSSFPYEPPQTSDSQPPSKQCTISFSTSDTQVQTVESSYSVGLSGSVGFSAGGFGLSLKDDQTWTWTNKTAIGSSTSSTQTASLNLTGPSYAYDGPISMDVYYDALYGSFLFIPDESDSEGTLSALSAKAHGQLSGPVTDAQGVPISCQEVSVQAADGKTYRTYTNSEGVFHFYHLPTGNGLLTSRSRGEQITIDETPQNRHLVLQE